MEEIVFVWVPGQVRIGGISAADFVAKNAIDGDDSDDYIPFSDLKPRLNSYITELWQNEWDSYPLNKLHKTGPKINEFLTSSRTNRREETVLSRPFIYDSLFPVERRITSLLYSMPWVALFRTHVIALLKFTWGQRKIFLANSLRMLFKNVPLDSIFNFLKELNAFNKL